MNLKKSIILIFFAIFLGAQVFVVLCPYSIMWGKNWAREDKPLWPFKRYPMYSEGRHPGGKLRFRELRIKSFNNNPNKMGITADYEMLHIMPARLQLLINVTPILFDSTFSHKKSFYQDFVYLNYLIRKYIPNSSRAEIWTRSFVLTKKGIKDFNVPWKLTCSWNVSNDTTYNNFHDKGMKNGVDN